jgi:hypothetical protein
MSRRRTLPSLTTLELARAIADAVLLAGPRRRRENTEDGPTQAVLETLRQTGSWFMTAKHDRDGIAIGETWRPLSE